MQKAKETETNLLLASCLTSFNPAIIIAVQNVYQIFTAIGALCIVCGFSYAMIAHGSPNKPCPAKNVLSRVVDADAESLTF